MRRIKLTQGKYAIVSNIDYKYLNQWKWYYLKHHTKGGYAVRNVWVNGRRKLLLMHRVILEQMGCKDFQKSDHIDRNKLNNLRSNLRIATDKQSNYNHGKFSNSTSKYIGVHWHKQHKKWYPRIMINGKSKSLGLFNSEIKAAKAYNKAARKYHEEFAVLNKV